MDALDQFVTRREINAATDATMRGVGVLMALAITKFATTDQTNEFWDEFCNLAADSELQGFVDQLSEGFALAVRLRGDGSKR
ncbi:MAG: hypothetical protein Q8K71_13940 [Polaromonas sp.]|nr:hypothetical protein [Polaromonas sp.]